MKCFFLTMMTMTAISSVGHATTNTFVTADCQGKVEAVLSAMRGTKVSIHQEALEYTKDHALLAFNADNQPPGKADIFLTDLKDVARGQYVYVIQCNLSAVQIYPQ